MSNKKFEIGNRVKVKRYPEIPMKVHLRYGGRMGKIKGMRHIKGRLWYKVFFGQTHEGFDNIEEFKAGELTIA